MSRWTASSAGRSGAVTRSLSRASRRASEVAAEPAVRRALVAQQQRIVASGDWVAEGRDIGTVVAPDAEVKVFLTADPAERARRRAGELGADVADALGAGLRPTWPADRRLGRLTIDHVLADERIAPRALTVHTLPRTDHRALVAELALPPG